jgi:hypothetical protein
MVVEAVRDLARAFRAFFAALSDRGPSRLHLPPGGARGGRSDSGGCARPASTQHRGVEREERYDVVETATGPVLRPAGSALAPCGHVETLIPTAGVIHAVTAAGRDTAVSIHVYGADIERLGSSIHRRYDHLPIERAAAA